VNDASDRVCVKCASQRVGVRDIPMDERHAGALIALEYEAKTVVLIAEIEADRLLAVVEKRLDRPRAQAAEGAGDQRSLS